MSPEEKLEMGRKLIAEAEAEIAAKKRNWPEELEIGMVFELGNGEHYLYCTDGWLVNMRTGRTFARALGFASMQSEFRYVGRASVLVRIVDDRNASLSHKLTAAHEPTGAELVEYELGPGDTIESTDEMYHPGFGERRSHNWRDSFPEGITVKLARAKCSGNIRFFRKVAR